MKYLLMFLLAIAAHLQAQTVSAGAPYQLHGVVSRQNGIVEVAVSSPCPVEQAMSVIRGEFGLVLDYEEGTTDDPARIIGTGSDKRLVGGSYTVNVPEPSLTGASDQAAFIRSLLVQFKAKGSREFTVIPGANGRLTVAPSSASQRVLDTPTTLKLEKRTISQTVEAILVEVGKERGIAIVRGGMIENDLENVSVEVGGGPPVAARVLLAQAPDGATYRKFWLFGWEPSLWDFVIRIQTAVKLEKTTTGEVREMPIR